MTEERDPTADEGATPRPKDPLRSSRTSRTWVAVVALVVVLLLLIIFIAQNTQRVEVSFLGWDGTTPLSVALLIAAAAGLVIAVTAGALRIWQLRRRVRRTTHG
jgi:uncharacterized integral membrane protein